MFGVGWKVENGDTFGEGGKFEDNGDSVLCLGSAFG